MASNDRNDRELSLSNSDEDIEYDIENEFNIRPILSTNTINDITNNGFVFETKEEQNSAEKSELGKSDSYWTREEISKHLESNPKPMDDICEDSGNYDERIKYMDTIAENGVWKRIVRFGTGGVVTEDTAVLYNLNAYLEGQDEPFDSTWLRGRPYLHKLNYDTVIPGLCMGLLTMRRGERSEFIVRPNYAYLAMGCPPRVPPNSTVLYIVEVVKVFAEGCLEHYETLSPEERQNVDFERILSLCDRERISGNSYFVQMRYREAAFRYRRAIRCLEQLMYKSEEDEKKSKEVLLKLYVNIANTYNKFQKPYNAMLNCKRALAIDPHSAKALYQYGLAKMANGDYKESRDLLHRASKLKPNDSAITQALNRLYERMSSDRLVEENLYRRMGTAFANKYKY